MALRRLNIDFEALARAMATQGSDENDYYLDTHTGRIIRISTDVWNALEEGETICWESQCLAAGGTPRGASCVQRYTGSLSAIPEDLEWEVEESMSDFTDTVRDADLRSKLIAPWKAATRYAASKMCWCTILTSNNAGPHCSSKVSRSMPPSGLRMRGLNPCGSQRRSPRDRPATRARACAGLV